MKYYSSPSHCYYLYIIWCYMWLLNKNRIVANRLFWYIYFHLDYWILFRISRSKLGVYWYISSICNSLVFNVFSNDWSFMLDFPSPVYIECIWFFGINCGLSCLAGWYGPRCRFPCNCFKNETCNQFVESLPTNSKIMKSSIAFIKLKKTYSRTSIHCITIVNKFTFFHK